MALAHITLATRDLAGTARFFAEALGWRRILRPNNVPYPAAWLEVAPGQELHLLELPDFAPSAFEREYGRHVAISYPRTGFSELKDRLRRQGAELIAADRPTPFERFFFRDPNGYVFEVVPEERVPETDAS
jgi:catechol 2,3-dioxygenase-like lactoylglutathione lyase family enzyme